MSKRLVISVNHSRDTRMLAYLSAAVGSVAAEELG